MNYTIHTGKSEEVLLQYPENTFDSCVTDPPYALEFMGRDWDKAIPSVHLWKEILRVMKPGAYLIAFSSPRTYHRLVCNIEDAGFEIRDQIFWVFGSGFPKSSNQHGEWEGWGSALKPAHEPICVARKPLIGTIPQNLAQFGTGAINIDACRIEGEPWLYGNQPKLNGGRYEPGTMTPFERHAENVVGGENGRWPANVIHDGSEEVLAHFPSAPGQMAAVGPKNGDRKTVNCYGDYGPRPQTEPRQELDKSAARFFYCAKTSSSDRNEGCEQLPEKKGGQTSNTSGQHITPRDVGYHLPVVKNHHPTVKPTDLMRYLVRLVTKKGGSVLDPFAGSGSTGKASILEHSIPTLIDMDEQWAPVQKARCDWANRNKDNQLGIFSELKEE